MPDTITYTVSCGTLREVVAASSANEAARKALDANDAKPGRTTLALCFEVRRKGTPAADAVYKLTETVLRDCRRLVQAEGPADA